MNAIVVLTVNPGNELLEFYSGFVRLGYRVFVVIDDKNFKFDDAAVKAKNAGVSLLQLDGDECRTAGFCNLTIPVNPLLQQRNRNGFASLRQAAIKSRCTAWEKALYYFCRRDLSDDNVWFIEDDCFIPNHEIILTVDRKHGKADIISAENLVNEYGALDDWPFWRVVPKTILRPPWAHSLVCALRLSRKTLVDFDSFIRSTKNKLRFTNAMIAAVKVASLFRLKSLWRKKLYVEYIFHTLALHNKLSVITAQELSGVVFRKEWDVSEMNPGTVYHPLKDRELHNRYRKILNQHTARKPDI